MRTDAITTPAHGAATTGRAHGEGRAARRTNRAWVWAGFASIGLLRHRR